MTDISPEAATGDLGQQKAPGAQLWEHRLQAESEHSGTLRPSGEGQAAGSRWWPSQHPPDHFASAETPLPRDREACEGPRLAGRLRPSVPPSLGHSPVSAQSASGGCSADSRERPKRHGRPLAGALGPQGPGPAAAGVSPGLSRAGAAEGRAINPFPKGHGSWAESLIRSPHPSMAELTTGSDSPKEELLTTTTAAVDGHWLGQELS